MRLNPEKKERKDAFVVTKPIQYINVLNIDNENKKILLLVGSFVDSQLVFERIKTQSKYWDEHYYFESILEVFKWLIRNKKQIVTLYIDSDINNRKQFSKLSKLNITLYEEGVGTYRRSQYKPGRNLLGALYLKYLQIRGYKNRRGGNKYTKTIIVYYPQFYKTYIGEHKKQIIGFKKPFIDHLKNNLGMQLFDFKIDLTSYTGKSVALYLSSWEIPVHEIELLQKIHCDKRILKPHPHLGKLDSTFEFDLVVPGCVPSELFILKLLDYASKVYLVSRYSTSTIYFLNHRNVEIINIPISVTPYNDTESYLDAYKNLTAYIGKKLSW